MDELAPGLHRWTARHPTWHPADAFGAEVASFALQTPDGDLLLVDPLLPDGAPGLLDDLAHAARNTYILVTIGYHVRSAQELSARYGAPVHGPKTLASRLSDPTGLHVLEAGDAPGPAGVRAFAIGRPRRTETPLHLPSQDAIAFGDALVTTPAGELRMWCQEEPTEKRLAFYRDRFAPTLRPLVDLAPRAILTTHGPPILRDASAALTAALDAEPWFHHS